MARRHSRWGRWGKHIELFDLWADFNEDPTVAEVFAEEFDEDDGPGLSEGTGGPEGRADFPIFLQTVIRHRMRERFRSVAAKWQSYVGVENAQDFRAHTTSELGAVRGIRPVNEDGEYKRMRSSEAPGPSYAVAKHGGVYAVTMELVINDDADQILNRTPREMGRAMAEYVSQLVVAFIESNPTYSVDSAPFFSAGRGNQRSTGANSLPNETNLMAALDQFQLRRDADNMPFTPEPQRILVRTPSQKATFDRILRSQLTGVVDTAVTNTALSYGQFFTGNTNPAYNVLPPDAVVNDVWLNDTDNWYIFGNIQDRPAFIIAYLRNNREPFIGLKDQGVRDAMGAGTDPYSWWFDHIEYKIRHILGVAAYEPFAVMQMQPT
jgi:hypothetical protein